MNKIVKTLLAVIFSFACFGIALLLASIPHWNSWEVDDIRSIMSYGMGVMIFSVSPISLGFLIWQIWRRGEKH